MLFFLWILIVAGALPDKRIARRTRAPANEDSKRDKLSLVEPLSDIKEDEQRASREKLSATLSLNPEVLKLPPMTSDEQWKGDTALRMCRHPTFALLPCDVAPEDALTEMDRILKYEELACNSPRDLGNAYASVDLAKTGNNRQINDFADAVDRIVGVTETNPGKYGWLHAAALRLQGRP